MAIIVLSVVPLAMLQTGLVRCVPSSRTDSPTNASHASRSHIWAQPTQRLLCQTRTRGTESVDSSLLSVLFRVSSRRFRPGFLGCFWCAVPPLSATYQSALLRSVATIRISRSSPQPPPAAAASRAILPIVPALSAVPHLISPCRGPCRAGRDGSGGRAPQHVAVNGH